MPAPESVAEGIAVIGLAGRFPGANDVPAFWRNLVAGRDGITRFTDEELAAAGYDPAALRTDPGFVPARGIMDRPEWFDAAFFGIQPREAEAIDPQQRVFMETAWHALEDAGCDPRRYAGLIGVYAGMSFNSYGRFVRARRDLVDAVGELIVTIGNEKDFLTTRLAYKLNLRGPALSINTACSTSLVALATACQSLACYQCDTAITGGVSITFPQTRGYFFREGGMASPDGVCRPFDAQAAGAVFSHGCGVVVLKRLADALAEGDPIYAVVKGWALNNDGAGKVSMTAPSIDGQAEAIALAHALAGTPPESIGYVEAHGTGTPLGDAIEVAALTQAFGGTSPRRKSCALGSLKSNIGHLEAAAGAVGFIKAALMLRHGQIPATLHFATANPELKLDDSPFYVSPKTIEWPRGATPRRAGVSSFGVGGTNAHVILEEAPVQTATTAGRPAQLLTLSARSESALDQAARDLAAHLEAHPALALADAAFTLQTGRQQFIQRRCIVAGSATEAIAALRTGAKLTRKDDRRDTPVAFIFPGQGSQYPRMGAQLYAGEPAFRAAFDTVAGLLQPELGLDLRAAIFSGNAEELRQTRITQPAIFAVGYALAQMWLSFGIRPNAMLGHSVGEYVAATLAGVFTVEDAARLVAARARLVQAQPGGAMLAVRLGESEAREFVSEQVSIAAINSTRLCVLSGPLEAITAVEARLTARNVSARRLATSHAFHSAMVAPVVAPFTDQVRAVRLRAPQIPFVSNITGEWITDAQAIDPAYWASHVRAAVRFADGLGKLLDASGRALLEAGPGNALTQLARQHPSKTAAHEFAHTLADETDEATTLAAAQGRLWLAGVPLDWAGVHSGEIRRRVSLPGYPFERQRYFADLPAGTPIPLTASALDGEPSATMSAGVASVAPNRETPAPSANNAAPSPDRQSALSRLTALLHEQTGSDFSGTDPKTTLLDLGFDSLFLAQLIIVIQKRFGVQIGILDFFDDLDSLGALAAHLGKHAAPPGAPAPKPPEARGTKPPPETAVIAAPVAPQGAVPVAEAQREVWLACQQGPLAGAAFNETCTVQFHGDFKIEVMLRAIQTVVDRHDTLRTTFSPDGETQIIAARLTMDVPVEDLSTQPAAERDGRLLALREAEGSRHFDLARGPLLAARIVKLAAAHHALIFTAHHIACDGWSYDIVLRELGMIYTALCEGRPHGLPSPMQMSDYQSWEEEQQRSASFAEDRAYWLERFKTPTAPLDLPGDRPRPPQRSHAGSRECASIPAELYRKLAHTGAKLGATPFVMLLAAFKTLLFRLSGERDFVVGVPAAGQNLAGGADLVGHCVNLLALRSTVVGSEPFADFLRTTRDDLFQSFEHQRFNFGQLIRHLPLPRDPSRVPLISSTFNLNPPHTDLRFAGLRHGLENNPRAAYQFDLSFNCYEQDGDLRVDCEYNTDLFDAATIRRWLGHYRTLLEAASADPSARLDALPLLTDAERETIVTAGTSRTRFTPDACIHALFEKHASATPDAIALTFEDRRTTYGALDASANRLAHHLVSRGVATGSLVAICLERSPDLLIAILAVLKAGGAYVPLDPDSPGARLGLILADANPHVLLTQENLLSKTAACTGGIFCVDRDAPALSHLPATPPPSPAKPESPAYVIYTSGSTGVPKGVPVTHYNVRRLFQATDHWFGFGASDVWTLFHSAAFDFSVWEIWGALCHGGRLVIVPYLVSRNPAHFYELVAREKVTVLNQTPLAFQQFLHIEDDTAARRELSLRHVIFGGEALDFATLRPWFDRHGDTKPVLVNMYGITETTVHVTYRPISATDLAANSGSRIGAQIPDLDLLVLDPNLAPCPIGVPGELHVGGAGVAVGYLGQPELTASRFIPHPWKGGERLYKSGDLARRTTDGDLEYLGRCDLQVKIRGFRIELGEIESVILQQGGIQQAAVIPQKDDAGDNRLIACVVRAAGSPLTERDLRAFLGQRLPGYMIPSAFAWLDALPMNHNGKLDARALPAIAGTDSAAEKAAPAETELQADLILIWEELLNRKPIGIRDSFFDLGGHSLMAVRLFSRISEKWNVDLSLQRIFEHPTVAELAATIESTPGRIESKPKSAPIPVARRQRRNRD
jgi:amino acid adenylation domain-containing protein